MRDAGKRKAAWPHGVHRSGLLTIATVNGTSGLSERKGFEMDTVFTAAAILTYAGFVAYAAVFTFVWFKR